jgi:hypothetical protein
VATKIRFIALDSNIVCHCRQSANNRHRRRFRPAYQPSASWLSAFLSILAMQYLVVLAWIPFRARDFATTRTLLHKFVWFDFDFALASIGLGKLSFFSTLMLLAAFAALHGTSKIAGHMDLFLGRVRLGWAAAVCVAFGFFAVFLWPLTDQPFIYFQF